MALLPVRRTVGPMSFSTEPEPSGPAAPSEQDGDDTDGRAEFAFVAALPEGPERQQILARLTETWRPTAHRLARRYAGRIADAEELKEAADTGLAEAVDRFSPDRDDAFETFADEFIRAQLQHRFADDDRIDGVLHEVSTVRDIVRSTLQELAHATELDSTVTARIAERTGLGEDDVVLGLEVLDSQCSLGLDTALVADADDDAPAGSGTHDALTEDELRILHMRYFRHLSVADIAAELGEPQPHIVRRLAHASNSMRALVTTE